MTEAYKHDAAAYAVGDPIYIRAGGRIWHTQVAMRYVVAKITPTGRIVAEGSRGTIRITSKGRIPEQDHWSVTSAEEAKAINAEAAIDRLWLGMRSIADRIEADVRKRDREAIEASIAELQEALSRLTGPSA